MASSFYSNSQHVDFESVLAMDDQAVIYEDALVDFFENSSVREGVIISTVAGQLVEISEEWFAESFELPVDGLGDLSEIPKDAIFDASSIVSLSGEPVNLSGRKNQMKIEFCLLCDILAKDISVKAGSFNALTVEKFSLITAVVCRVRMNWGRILFSTLKKMVSPGSKQAKGFAIQISLLLENIPNLELGESSEFPTSKILTDKTVYRFVSLNDRDAAEEATRATKPRAASKKRPSADVGAAVTKNKRTIKKKSVTSHSTLEMVAVAQEAVPITMVEASAGVPSAKQPAAWDNVPANQPVVEDTGEAGDQETAEDVGKRDGESVFVPTVAHTVDVETSAADDVDHIIQQVLSETAESVSTEEFPWFVLPFIRADRNTERLFETACDSADAMEVEVESQDLPVVRESVVGTVSEQDMTAFGEQLMGKNDESSADTEAETVEKSVDEFIDDDEARSLEDILLSIPLDVPLPSSSMEITKIQMGKEIKIQEIHERTWFLNSLPKIPAANKGKAVLVEKDPMKGNPAQEHYFLICADIDMLVNLRAMVIDEVAQFFNSFSLKKLATMDIEEMYKKEEQVLSWGETESPKLAIQRKLYILLKYREVLVRKFLESWKSNFVPGQGSSAVDLSVIYLLSDLHLFILEELAKEACAHGLLWKKTCCSKIFEGSPGDRGAVIARSNTNTRSSCWIRTIVEVPRQRQYDDTLPPVNIFYKKLTKRWDDIFLEVVDFCASRRLLPVGSLQFCGSVSVTEPVYRVAPLQSTVFAFRVSQFCSVFVDFSLFSWLPSADITDLLSSIALDRTAFRVVQIAQERSILRNVQSSVLVAPSVQLSLDQRQSSHISYSDSDPTINFTSDDVQLQDRPADNRTSFPASSTDFSEAIDDLKTYLAQSIADSQNDILSKLNTVARHLREDMQHHENTVRAQVNNSCQDTRLNINGLIVNLGEYRKGVKTFGASVKTDNLDIQRKIDAQQAKLDDLDTQIASMRNDQSGDAKKGEVGSSSRSPPIHVERRPLPAPQPSPDVQGSGATQLTGGGSAERTPTFPPTVGTFAERVAMAQRHIIRVDKLSA
ncbi:dystroglycan-like [Dorcoceras hygrometricum]|uniref:Dystroglycan-like n=1 Tax=Dorcoceras hygrometricum TaxID=472368 RepID=A0A2Z7A8K9_9LAMI|nr:dystroglycan-like [Dorcoceras hygrometricum]